ncbi:MAG: hypothetical protein HKN26_10330 [Acidimicrobiales bacterium]|nr:hypothetical protein [Acidimicrobiales bacterium]
MADADPDEAELREQALDLFVYAPIGLALEARDLLPKLVQRGRGQVALARVMGRFAAQKGQTEANKVVSAAVDGFRNGLNGTDGSDDTDAATEARRAVKGDDDSLAIEGYDQLAAAQVVKRLPALDPAELKAIAAYEGSHRQRVTILNRAAKLLEDDTGT